MGFGIELKRVFGSFVVIPNVFIIIYIRGDQYFLPAVFRAALQHKHLFLFKDDLSVDPAQAFGAKTERKIVINVFTNGHLGGFLADQGTIFLRLKRRTSRRISDPSRV
jgi:hypothetical protein